MDIRKGYVPDHENRVVWILCKCGTRTNLEHPYFCKATSGYDRLRFLGRVAYELGGIRYQELGDLYLRLASEMR